MPYHVTAVFVVDSNQDCFKVDLQTSFCTYFGFTCWFFSDSFCPWFLNISVSCWSWKKIFPWKMIRIEIVWKLTCTNCVHICQKLFQLLWNTFWKTAKTMIIRDELPWLVFNKKMVLTVVPYKQLLVENSQVMQGQSLYGTASFWISVGSLY